jgi:hypothetical protein
MIQSWQRLVDGVWTTATPPNGGLLQSTVGGARDVVVAPPWPVEPSHPQPQAEWIDEQGELWRKSGAGNWQLLIDGIWVNTAPPSGGLRKLTGPQDLPDAVVIEMTGPEGPQGPPGPPGSGGLLVAEVLSIEFQDGVNNTFPLSTDADLSQAFQVFRNGLLEIQGHGFLVTPTHVTFTTPPLDSDVLTVIYQKAQ